MREIKFRGFYPYWEMYNMQNGWIVGYLKYDPDDDEYLIQSIGEGHGHGEGYYVEKDTIGQYTGLKDKNGTEIYEGDIIREKVAEDEYILAEVVYVNGCFMGKEPTHEPEYPIHDFLKGEVIGNIYELEEPMR